MDGNGKLFVLNINVYIYIRVFKIFVFKCYCRPIKKKKKNRNKKIYYKKYIRLIGVTELSCCLHTQLSAYNKPFRSREMRLKVYHNKIVYHM